MKQTFSAFVLLLVCLGTHSEAQPRPSPLPRVDGITHKVFQEILKRDSGKVILVNAWATWCAPCKKELPSLVKLRKDLRKKGFELILVSADDPDLISTKIRMTLRKMGVNFQSYVMQDTTDEAFMNGLNPDWRGALPASFLYDKRGRLDTMLVGERTYAQFSEEVRELLEK